MYPEGALTPRSPTTPSVILDPPSGRYAQVTGNKILPPKHMLQRLLILLAQIHAGNTSENLVHKIWSIIYSLNCVKQISKNYKIVSSNKQRDITETIIMNSGNSKSYHSYRLVFYYHR